MRPKKRCGWCALVTVLTFAGSVDAQEGVTVITQARAATGGVTPGDTPGFPVTISQGGSYRLDSNLEVPDGNTTAIEITVPNVTVDLNGFGILGPGIAGSGVGINAPFPSGNVSVRNGTVKGMGNTGIRLARGCRVEGVSVGGNDVGIFAREGAIIINNSVGLNRGVGIRVLGGSVTGNTVTLNRGLGLELGVANPTPNEVGIVVGYANNVLVDNADPQVSGGIQMGPNVCGSLGTARLCGEKEKK
jgi:hypothetical protein